MALATHSQSLTAPVAQGVYGGTVEDIEVYQTHADSVYLIISTRSPNSLFYGRGYRGSGIANVQWTPLPSADEDDGFGGDIQQVEVHHGSQTIFFLHQGTLYTTTRSAPSATPIDQLVKNFIIYGDTLLAVKNSMLPGGQDTLEFGAISPSGIYTSSAGMSLLKNYTDPPQMVIDPSTQKLHLFERGSSPHMYVIQDPVYAMTNSSPLTSALNPAPSVTNIEWRTYGFSPDGTWYVAGQPPLNNPMVADRHIAWSSNNGFVWNDSPMNTPGPQGGVVGSNFVIEDLSAGRHIFIGNAINTDTSNMNNWQNPGSQYIGDLNRANDGATKQDPLHSDIKYHTTNVGFGYSTSNGDSIFGWNEGLLAIQVNDIDMNDTFSIGWVASKSGIRSVTDYGQSSETWSSPTFPNGDGAPYRAAGMDPQDDQTIFVGNQRIYKTSNGGTPIGPGNDGWARVFTPEDPPYNFNSINSYCTTIEVSPSNSNLIMVGYSGDFGQRGGVFYSTDGGANWDQLLLVASTPGQDVNVQDIEWTEESGMPVAYIGLQSDPVSSGQYGLFRAEWSGSSWSVARDGSYGATDGIVDIQRNLGGDTLVFLNTDPGINPINSIQIKELATGTWTSQIGPWTGGYGAALTVGDGYIFMAIGEQIHTMPMDLSSGWTYSYTYPIGTEINVLFYDELLVGTGTGLYAQYLDKSTISVEEWNDSKDHHDFAFPNPANDQLILRSLGIFKVFSTTGELIAITEHDQKYITTTNWPSGLYLLVNENGETQRIGIVH
ncbi:MAG: hypothetical protein SchgKO_16250 [Schleiferiaceae bacterium]